MCGDYYCSRCCFYCKICDNFYYNGCLEEINCSICGIWCCDKCHSSKFDVKCGSVNLSIQTTDNYICEYCKKTLCIMLSTSGDICNIGKSNN